MAAQHRESSTTFDCGTAMTALYKAQPVSDEAVPDFQLSAVTELPAHTRREVFDEQGAAIVAAMLASLPGGTVDAVLRALLEHRASLLHVRFR